MRVVSGQFGHDAVANLVDYARKHLPAPARDAVIEYTRQFTEGMATNRAFSGVRRMVTLPSFSSPNRALIDSL